MESEKVMKSRSEIMRERATAEASKSSASSRTLDIPGTEGSKTVHCPDCEIDLSTGDLKKRKDGMYECSSCAMPLKVGEQPTKKEVVTETKSEPNKGESTARSKDFCGQCGCEWPLVNGKTVISCGHMRAIRVDDPRKAEQMKQATASGVTNIPSTPVSAHLPPLGTPMPVTTIVGNTIYMSWGKIIFPVGEALGVSKFSNMDIGPFSLTQTVPQGSTVEVTVRGMLADLQKIADLAFDTQFVWYKKKLGVLDK